MQKTLLKIRKLVEQLDAKVVAKAVKAVKTEEWKPITKKTPHTVLLLFDAGYGLTVCEAGWIDERNYDDPNTWSLGSGSDHVEPHEAIAWKPMPKPPLRKATVKLLKQLSAEGGYPE